MPDVKSRHEYLRHDHLKFDGRIGRRAWRDEINLVLRRNGMNLELNKSGTVVRPGSVSAQLAMARPLPLSGDESLDRLLATSIAKYQDPDPDTRRESLEQLWDAFERVKTVLDVDKKNGVRSLIERMADTDEAQELLDDEFVTLTKIGNNFRIRHHETDKNPVPDSLIDYLFTRAFSLLDRAIKVLAE